MASQLQVADVFGVSNASNPLSYIERKIDDEFRKALLDRKHSVIVIYGMSKQGKSSLRRHILPNDFCTFVPADSGMSLEALYREVLNQAGALGPIQYDTEVGGGLETNAGLKIPSWLAPIAIGAKAWAEAKAKRGAREIEVDYSTAASVARKYHEVAGKRPIVIDNFHYFSRELQDVFSTQIRAFEEHRIKIVIMGTWKARDYLAAGNNDLETRTCPLSIEPWSPEDFARVIAEGEHRLNVAFSGTVRATLIQKASGNIGLLQEAIAETLERSGVHERERKRKAIEDDAMVRQVFRTISERLVAGMSAKLKKVTEIGDAWANGKTRTYYIVKAYLEDQESERSKGVPLERLVRKTNEIVARATMGRQTLPKEAISALVKRDWLPGQQRLIQTPILAHDPAEDRLIALDSWLLLTLRHHRQEIAREFS